MTFLDIKKAVIERSGRFDLVVDLTDYVDAGVDAFIHAGQRYLEGRISGGPTRFSVELSLTAGTSEYTYPSGLRAALSTKLLDTDGTTLYVLNQISLQALQGLPESTAVPICVAYDFANRQIYVYPTPDQAYKLQIDTVGRAEPLADDDDDNWWTLQYPEALILSALYRIEIANRNTEGARDWLLALEEDLRNIEIDIIEQENETYQQQDIW